MNVNNETQRAMARAGLPQFTVAELRYRQVHDNGGLNLNKYLFFPKEPLLKSQRQQILSQARELWRSRPKAHWSGMRVEW